MRNDEGEKRKISASFFYARQNHSRFCGIVRGRLRGLRRFPGRQHWGGQIVEFLEALVSEPEDVETGFVAVEKPACPHFFIIA